MIDIQPMEKYHMGYTKPQMPDVINKVWAVNYNGHIYQYADTIQYIAGIYTSLEKAKMAFPKVRWIKASYIESWSDEIYPKHDRYFGFIENEDETRWYEASYQIYDMELNKTYADST